MCGALFSKKDGRHFFGVYRLGLFCIGRFVNRPYILGQCAGGVVGGNTTKLFFRWTHRLGLFLYRAIRESPLHPRTMCRWSCRGAIPRICFFVGCTEWVFFCRGDSRIARFVPLQLFAEKTIELPFRGIGINIMENFFVILGISDDVIVIPSLPYNFVSIETSYFFGGVHLEISDSS